MALVPMQKVAIFGHQDHKEQILTQLHRIELLQITSTNLGEKEVVSATYEAELGELKAAIDFLDHYSGKKKTFIETLVPPKEPVAEDLLFATFREFDWRETIKRIKDLEAEIINLKNLENKLKEEINLLFPWTSLNIPLNQLTCGKNICLSAGTCKLKELANLRQKLEKFSSAVEVEEVSATKEKIYLLIFYLSSEEKTISDLLSKSGFEKVLLPLSERTPQKEVMHLQKILHDTKESQKRLLEEVSALLKHREKLTYVYDYLYQKYLEQQAQENIRNTKKVFILSGWVPKKHLEKLKIEISKITPLCEVQPILAASDEVPPTLIENPKTFYPFELITRIFGLPGQRELDPTIALSFFYLLFFAVCLSDVGYGIILAAVSFYLLKKLTLPEGGKKLLLLLFWGGIATVFVGIFTGSYFGMDLNTLPAPFSQMFKKLQIIDPIKNPLQVLIISLALGVIQNLFGILLAFWQKIKNREYLEAFLDQALWFYFLSSLVFWLICQVLSSPLTSLSMRATLVGAFLLVITQGRSEANLPKKIISGVLSLYRTTSYLGDTLSYSRLLALMMTTSIIGMVVNILAGLTKNSIPYLGYVIMIAILLVGHAFNLVVSVLGAFIHAARLQLVEFFGKFYEGSGKEFRPLRRETKYVIIK